MLISKQPMEVNKSMSLTIDIPDETESVQKLMVKARSVRCVKDMDFDYYNTGFAFERISNDEKKLIDILINLYEL